MEYIINHWPEMLALLISLGALFVSWKSWQKNRSIYNLEFHEFLPDQMRDVGNKKIREKLNSGDYTILHTDYRAGQYNILIGKIKR